MNVAIVTKEYPPHVYGGAGVHVEYLTQELAKLDGEGHRVRVFCFGEQDASFGNTTVKGIEGNFPGAPYDPRHREVFNSLFKDLVVCASLQDVDIIHCHTWYTHFAGCLAKQLLGVPLVLTTHSLEPHRPWKEEQLGTGYRASSWLEETAYKNADGVIAVSASMANDVNRLYGVPPERIRVLHNGIDLNRYKPSPNEAVLSKYGIEPDRPFVLFVGRITRQKGIIHLVNAVKYIQRGVQVVLCAGAPDTREIGEEMERKVELARSHREDGLIWITGFLPKEEVISLYTHAAVFICPSVYEPFGIINLEAMACGTPVVATRVGGIPDAVVHGETGLLVPLEQRGPFDAEPVDAERFSKDLAAAVNAILGSKARMESMARKARERVEKHFSWRHIAVETLAFYGDVIKRHRSSS